MPAMAALSVITPLFEGIIVKPLHPLSVTTQKFVIHFLLIKVPNFGTR
jgi:hypothetical protein